MIIDQNQLDRKSNEWGCTDPSGKNEIHYERNKATTMEHDDDDDDDDYSHHKKGSIEGQKPP